MKLQYLTLAIALSAGVALSGCGPEKMTKPGASAQDYDIARARCEGEALVAASRRADRHHHGRRLLFLHRHPVHPQFRRRA